VEASEPVDDRQRSNLFLVGASVASTIIVLDVVHAWAPIWRTDVEIALAVIAVATILTAKKLP
jgi:hypothetical protein